MVFGKLHWALLKNVGLKASVDHEMNSDFDQKGMIKPFPCHNLAFLCQNHAYYVRFGKNFP